MGKTHVMMVPFPMQGHVIPLLELAQCLARHSIRVTFVNTEIIHDRVVNALSGEDELEGRIRLVSVPDGLESGERYVPGKLTETLYKVMPQKIEELVQEIDASEEEEEKITCLVYDQSLGTIQEVAKKMGIRSAAFLPAAAALLVLSFNIPKLIEDGIVDNEGTPLKNEMVQFAPTMPIMSPSDFVWHRVKILTLQKLIFDIMTENNKATKSADWLIGNSIYDLEPGAFTIAPQIVPIGPLLASNGLGNSAGHFWQQDSNCLEWLDQQPPCSVIYVAFGSSTIFKTAQFQELALGLEHTNRPFLWVARPDYTSRAENQGFPEGFLDRVSSTRGRIIGWAPQQKVLSHPSTACFISHCGWNSTVESVSNGVPILCWPYFADQFINQSYICDIWKKKIDQLLGDDMFKERALHIKEMIWSSAREGGNSYKNLRNFISWIQE
ncbi:hypothetical protein Pfo_019551 [Paulownia fortunei]|nr:hypothetical protein Pfo_019551 [Paulownia fortunei]